MIKNITVAADNTDKLIACTESVWSSQAHSVFGDEFYISDSGGASWVRINDDQHQFGGLGNGNFIVGDNNIYGRCYISTICLGLVYCDKVNKN